MSRQDAEITLWALRDITQKELRLVRLKKGWGVEVNRNGSWSLLHEDEINELLIGE